jgi:hypothetical protein
LRLVRRTGEESILVTSSPLPLEIRRTEFRGGFASWALLYAARFPRIAYVERVYRRVGETLVYREA